MLGAASIWLVGAGLVLIARLFGGSASDDARRSWRHPPSWARLVFGAPRDRILAEDAIVESIGLLWLISGIALAVAGQSPDSSAFRLTAMIVSLSLVVGGPIAVVSALMRQGLLHR